MAPRICFTFQGGHVNLMKNISFDLMCTELQSCWKLTFHACTRMYSFTPPLCFIVREKVECGFDKTYVLALFDPIQIVLRRMCAVAHASVRTWALHSSSANFICLYAQASTHNVPPIIHHNDILSG